MPLTNDEILRYGRQLTLPGFGQEGQIKLKSARVLLVGAGGLGSPQAIYLAAAGIGTLGIIDPELVEVSNLHRQVVHFSSDVGKAKVVSAQEKIAQLNPGVKVQTFPVKFSAQNALDILKDYDLVIDGTDNFPSRYLINDACIFAGKPFVYGGILRFEGQCSVFGLQDGPCYRCFFQEPPAAGEIPSCAEAGVLGVLPGIIGLLQSNEAIKMICGLGESLKGRLLIFDALTTQFREVRIKKDPHCPMCGPQRTIHQLKEYNLVCPTEGQPSSSQQEEIPQITVQVLKEILRDPSPDVYLLDVREPPEWEIAHIPQAVLKPLSTLEEDYQDIPKDKRIFVHCKLGGRSTLAIQFLKSKGYDNCVNITGGIDAWAKEIDPQMPRY